MIVYSAEFVHDDDKRAISVGIFSTQGLAQKACSESHHARGLSLEWEVDWSRAIQAWIRVPMPVAWRFVITEFVLDENYEIAETDQA